ncbi:MAG: YraN family protein [Alphaproteobacteria bacterium]|nr:YraN family protein [Alphaproteobacteria bacterium]
MSVGERTQDRRQRELRGRRAEAKCLWALRLRGYRVIARRLKTPRGEIDIIARRRGILAFIEVKARDTASAAAEAVSARQRRRIERAAEAFVAARPNLAALMMRFDVMIVLPGRLPIHLRDAWQRQSGSFA